MGSELCPQVRKKDHKPSYHSRLNLPDHPKRVRGSNKLGGRRVRKFRRPEAGDRPLPSQTQLIPLTYDPDPPPAQYESELPHFTPQTVITYRIFTNKKLTAVDHVDIMVAEGGDTIEESPVYYSAFDRLKAINLDLRQRIRYLEEERKDLLVQNRKHLQENAKISDENARLREEKHKALNDMVEMAAKRLSVSRQGSFPSQILSGSEDEVLSPLDSPSWFEEVGSPPEFGKLDSQKEDLMSSIHRRKRHGFEDMLKLRSALATSYTNLLPQESSAELRQVKRQLNNEIKKLQEKANMLEATVRARDETIRSVIDENDQLRDLNLELQVLNDETNEELGDSRLELDKLSKQLQQAKKRLGQDSDVKVRQLERLLAKVTRQYHDECKAHSELKRVADSIVEENQRLKERENELSYVLQGKWEMDKELDKKHMENRALRRESTQMKKIVWQLRDKEMQMKKELDASKKALREKMKDPTRLAETNEVLQQLNKEYEGDLRDARKDAKKNFELAQSADRENEKLMEILESRDKQIEQLQDNILWSNTELKMLNDEISIRNIIPSSYASHKAHTDTVSTCSYSPDGTILATGSYDGTIVIWDTVNWQCKRTLDNHSRPINCITFSTIRDLMASGGDDNIVLVYDISNWTVLFTLSDHLSHVMGVLFDPFQSALVSVSLDATVRVWSSETGDPISQLDEHTDNVYDLSFHPTKQWLVTCGADKAVILWDTNNWFHFQTLFEHEAPVNSISFHPGGENFATGSSDGIVIIWTFDSGVPIHILQLHEQKVRWVGFDPTGRILTTCGEDERAVVVHASNFRKSYDLTLPSTPTCAAFHPFGNNFVTTHWDHTFRVF